MLKYCLHKCTQRICDEAADGCLPALKFVLEWFVSDKMIRKLHEVLFTNDNILFLHEDFGKVTFFGGEMGIISVDLDKIDFTFIKMILKLLF